jgi:hypothetical protein
MKTMMKKAEMGMKTKPAAKKPMAPAPKKKSYPILSDDGENYNGPKAGPREKNPNGMSKNGSMMKKAKMGTSLGMKSVKAGYDDNAGVTRADFVSIGKGEAKTGAKISKAAAYEKSAYDKKKDASGAHGKEGSAKDMKADKAAMKMKMGGTMAKKAGMHKMPDGSMMKNSMMKMGGAMAKQAAVAIAMKKAGKSPKKKMQYGGEAASMVPPAMMKKGGMMKKCKYGCK